MSEIEVVVACEDVIASLIAQLEFSSVKAAMREESNVTATLLAVDHQLVFDILDTIIHAACAKGEQVITHI